MINIFVDASFSGLTLIGIIYVDFEVFVIDIFVDASFSCLTLGYVAFGVFVFFKASFTNNTPNVIETNSVKVVVQACGSQIGVAVFVCVSHVCGPQIKSRVGMWAEICRSLSDSEGFLRVLRFSGLQ